MLITLLMMLPACYICFAAAYATLALSHFDDFHFRQLFRRYCAIFDDDDADYAAMLSAEQARCCCYG